MRPLGEYLQDLLTYITDVEAFSKEGSAAFKQDRKSQLATIRAYEVIGEIVKRLPSDLLATQSDIDWKAIKGFRDVLIHQYANVDLDVVWGAVERLPTLKAAVEKMLAQLPPE